jgi:L-threonylcarbamoyladenylate synthase
MSAVIDRPNRASIARAAARLRAGELVGFPTENGLRARCRRGSRGRGAQDLRRERATPPIHARHRPLVRHGEAREMGRAPCSEWARKLAAGILWPRAADADPAARESKRWDGRRHRRAGTSVGIRVPSHPVAARAPRRVRRRNRRAVGQSLRTHFRRRQRSTFADDLGGAVSIILDGGPVRWSEIESTHRGIHRRQTRGCSDRRNRGRRSRAKCSDVRCGRLHAAAPPERRVLLATHYAPKTPATLAAPGALARRARAARRARRHEVNRGPRALYRSAACLRIRRTCGSPRPIDAAAYAHDLYANLARSTSRETPTQIPLRGSASGADGLRSAIASTAPRVERTTTGD